MPPRVTPNADPARRHKQITDTFKRAVRDRKLTDGESARLRTLVQTPEDRQVLRDLFDAARRRNPGLAAGRDFASLFGDAGPTEAVTRIDRRPIAPSGYRADMSKLNALFPGDPPMRKVEDAFTATVDLNGTKIAAPTHLFGKPVNIIPYSNEDNVVDAAGRTVARGDAEIAKVFQPGEIGIAIKHHRPAHRSLGGPSGDDKENIKLQDTHIEIVVGVAEKGPDGSMVGRAVTVNNPQTYENGQFGQPDYPMIFVRPKFPDYLNGQQVAAFQDNIRTMLVGFNTVTKFPGNYNGGDPLGARSPEQVEKHVEKMVRAVAGDADAKAWFAQPENQVYCAELAHLAMTAGVLFPLNRATWEPVVGREVWSRFEAQIQAHNGGTPDAFSRSNGNPNIGKIGLTLAPEDLRPMTEYAPESVRPSLSGTLAFKPMTMADIVEQFLRTHVPREQAGEELAPAQGAMLESMKPGLLESMGLDRLPASDPRRQAVEALFGQMVQVVGKKHGSYAEFRAAVEPLLAQARQITGPRGNGEGLFTPPSLFHVVAQGKNPGGLIDLEYVGHGLHTSVVRPD